MPHYTANTIIINTLTAVSKAKTMPGVAFRHQPESRPAP